MRRAAFATLAVVVLAACKSSSDTTPDAGLADAAAGSDAAVAYDFGALDAELFGKSWKTEGVVVLHAGQLVYERYAPGWDATMRHITYSASKTIGGALVGIAIGQGVMKLTDSICTYVTPPAGADPKLCDTTIEHLLHMGSGLTWPVAAGTLLEDEANPNVPGTLQMLYGNQPSMGAYVAVQPRLAPAGTTFLYSSGDSNLLALALKNALYAAHQDDVGAWAKRSLFDPAGLASAIFESDRNGALVFSSSCFLTPRDFAKLGQLYLDDGVSGGARVLPDGWVQYSLTPAPPVSTSASRTQGAGAAPGGSYGAQIWLNAATPTATADTLEYPQEPIDGYNFEGHYGQKVIVIPSRRLVIARVGNDRDPAFDPGPMIGAAVGAIDHGGATLSAASRRVSLVADGGAVPGPVNEFQVLTGFSAKETCSCVFVVGQTDAYCSAFGQQAGYAVTIAIDRAAKTVKSTFTTASRTAYFMDGQGCVLDGL